MNTLSQLITSQEQYLGFSERNRLTEEKRIAAINTALKIVYGLLANSSILKKTSTVICSSNTASPPSDFNEGNILYMGDASTFDNSDEIYEVDEQVFGRLDDNDDEFFVQRYNSSTGDLEFIFNDISNGTFYIEYERGAPTLSDNSDFDGLPSWSKEATAKLSAGILTGNLLADDTKMAVALYGPTGNKSVYSPDSVYGILMRGLKQRRIKKQVGRNVQTMIYDRNNSRQRINYRRGIL